MEPALENGGVLDRISGPVVVEVCEDIDVLRPAVESRGPLVELGGRIVAISATGATVKTDEREISRELVRLERVDGGSVGDHQCRPMLS